MPKGDSIRSSAEIQTGLDKKEKFFYFLEGVGTLLWVLGDFTWLFEIEYVFPVMYILAVLGNFAALMYASLKLRHTIPLMPVIAYNFWVIMGCLWTFVDITGSEGILLAAKVIGIAMLLITVYEFGINRNNKENILAFMITFRKFRIYEETAGLSVSKLLSLSDEMFDLIIWMAKHGDVDMEEVASFMKQDEADSQKTLTFLANRRFIKEIQVDGKTRYRVRLASRRGREVPLDLIKAPGENSKETEIGN